MPLDLVSLLVGHFEYELSTNRRYYGAIMGIRIYSSSDKKGEQAKKEAHEAKVQLIYENARNNCSPGKQPGAPLRQCNHT